MKKNANMAILITRYYFLFFVLCFVRFGVLVPFAADEREAVPRVAVKNTKKMLPSAVSIKKFVG